MTQNEALIASHSCTTEFKAALDPSPISEKSHLLNISFRVQ